MSEYILEMDNICKSFSGVQVLHHVNLKVRKGTLHALMGENGAGKSTLMKILIGAHRADSGTIRFNGEDLEPSTLTVHQALGKGISMIFQELCLVPDMSVAENIFIGREPKIGKTGIVDRKKLIRQTQELLDSWKAGEATEESFAALANENSEDPGSSTNGGLYEDVYPGQMVDSFDAWCFDEARQPGDTGIVKTDYGYHVMYFVSKGEEIFWFETAKGDLLSERAADLEDALREKYPMELTLENAAIFDVQAEDRAAANAAAEEAAQSETASDEAGDTQEAAAEGTQEAANE